MSENTTFATTSDLGPNAEQRYQLLIKARNFHYENYSKWMTYFYVAISAIFLSFITVLSKPIKEIPEKFLVETSLLVLGYVVCLLWFWSSKGYYYWNINFISLVNYYEIEVFQWKKEERVYNLFYDKSKQNNYGSPVGGANISTSKVAILFAFIVSCFFGFFLSYRLIAAADCCRTLAIAFSMLVTPVATILISYLVPKSFLYSKIDEMAELKDQPNCNCN